MTTAREARAARWRGDSRWSMTWRFAAFFNLLNLVIWLTQIGLASLGWAWMTPSPAPHTGDEVSYLVFHGLFVGLFSGFFLSFVWDRTPPSVTPPGPVA